MDQSSISDEIRGVRQRKKHCDPTCCPVCGITVRSHEIEQHYALEVDKLHKPSNSATKRKSMASQMPKDVPGCSSITTTTTATNNIAAATDTDDPSDCWATFQRIKNNRQARLKVKNKKRKTDDPLCPICNERIADDIIAHVDFCLQRSEGKSNGANSDDDDDSVDVESETFDEYEWAGQTRIRASSMLDGGYSAAGIGTQIIYNKNNNNNNNMDDEDEDLNVDGDDTQIFGEPQYSERDIILPLAELSDKKGESLYLRNLAIGQNSSPSPSSSLSSSAPALAGETTKIPITQHWNHMDGSGPSNHILSVTNLTGNVESSKSGANNSSNNESKQIDITKINNVDDCEMVIETAATSLSSSSSVTITDTMTTNWNTTNTTSTPNNNKTNHQNSSKEYLVNNPYGQKQIIESLKEKIREYETQIRNKSKCLICIDEFRQPVVSICCWHVHCEECWLRTLGARKLCPQCNMITSPADLRRIYM